MARRVATDPLQVFPFHLFDVSVTEALQLPVFSPLLGFKSITMPEVTLEMQEITEGNWLFPRKVIKRASLNTLTLERASTFTNSDFWNWTMAALSGDTNATRFGIGKVGAFLSQVVGGVTPRKTLVLVHFLARGIGSDSQSEVQASVTSGGKTIHTTSLANTFNADRRPGVNIGPFEFTPRIPARAWILHGCLPVRCKPGSDFDATSSDISMQEIELAYESVEQVDLS